MGRLNKCESRWGSGLSLGLEWVALVASGQPHCRCPSGQHLLVVHAYTHTHTDVHVRGCGSSHGTAGGVGLGLAHGWEVSL